MPIPTNKPYQFKGNLSICQDLSIYWMRVTSPVAYLGGPWCDAPSLWPDHENFLQATLYEKVRFLQFFSKFYLKMGEFAASIERSKAKNVSASGGEPPDPPTRSSAPGSRWGLRPQTLL